MTRFYSPAIQTRDFPYRHDTVNDSAPLGPAWWLSEQPRSLPAPRNCLDALSCEVSPSQFLELHGTTLSYKATEATRCSQVQFADQSSCGPLDRRGFAHILSLSKPRL